MFELDKEVFASGAEAIAHYYKQGFRDAERYDDDRMMKATKGDYEITIRITHESFLYWRVTIERIYDWAGDWNNRASRHHY